MADTGHFKGAGNVIWELALPLNEVMQEQLTKGYLRRVNEDGSPYAEPAEGREGEQRPEQVEAPPAANASKAHWVGYAHRVHDVSIDDAEAMTKNDLMELYGSQG
jgi:hypothetical protein